ncbi:MAG: toll/interleukin-1 receptor domain-containing protein [Ornithinimicrobium sp.]
MAVKSSVFISWSGERSKEVASTLKKWIEEEYDLVSVFFSDDSIEAGQRGIREIHEGLHDADAAVVVVTSESMTSAWVNYEVGVMSGYFKESAGQQRKVIPVLVDLDSPAQMEGPIRDFQAVTLDRKGLLKMLESINLAINVPPSKAEQKLERSWERLEPLLEEAKTHVGADSRTSRASSARESKRTVEEMVTEVLELVREQSRLQFRPVQIEAGIGASWSRQPGRVEPLSKVVVATRKALSELGYGQDTIRGVEFDEVQNAFYIDVSVLPHADRARFDTILKRMLVEPRDIRYRSLPEV